VNEPGLEELAARVDLATWRLRRGELVRAQELAELGDRAVALAPALTAADQVRVANMLQRLVAAATDWRRTAGERLEGMRAARRAVRGYGVLKNQRPARLRRRA
jgi:replicative DNA helicase